MNHHWLCGGYDDAVNLLIKMLNLSLAMTRLTPSKRHLKPNHVTHLAGSSEAFAESCVYLCHKK